MNQLLEHAHFREFEARLVSLSVSAFAKDNKISIVQAVLSTGRELLLYTTVSKKSHVIPERSFWYSHTWAPLMYLQPAAHTSAGGRHSLVLQCFPLS